jgi:hypothetical protein
MTFNEHDTIVLTVDLPQHRLQAGDIGTIVHVHGAGAGYEVEFLTLSGETVAVTSLAPTQMRAIAPREIAHVRAMAG